MVKMPLRWQHSQVSFSLLRAVQTIVGYPYELTTTIKFDLGTFPSLNFGVEFAEAGNGSLPHFEPLQLRD